MEFPKRISAGGWELHVEWIGFALVDKIVILLSRSVYEQKPPIQRFIFNANQWPQNLKFLLCNKATEYIL